MAQNDDHNCVATANPNQRDADGDGVGNGCEDAITLSAPRTVGIGEAVSISVAMRGPAINLVDFGDGTATKSSNPTVTTTYDTPGTYTVTVDTTLEGSLLLDRNTVTVEVVGSSDQPQVDASLDTTSNNVSGPIRFAVSGTDLNGTVDSVVLLDPTRSVVDSTTCGTSTCTATLSGTPTAAESVWNASAGRHDPVTYVVRGTNDAGQTNTTAVPVQIAIAGDSTADGRVDVFDTVVLGRAWNTTSGDAEYDVLADLDNDSRVDDFDRRIVAVNWAATVRE